MKYVLFVLAMLAAIPGAIFCGMSRRMLAIAMVLMFIPLLDFNSTALNFISYEFYRGTSRGMEVSLIYIIAGMLLLSFVFRKKLPPLIPDLGVKLYLAYFGICLVSACTNNNSMVVEGVTVAEVFQSDFLLSGRMLSFFELWKMLMLLLVFWAVYGYLDATSRPETIIKTLAAFGIFFFLTVVRDHYAGIYQVRSVFPHQNSFAMFLMLIGPIFLSVYLVAPKNAFRTLCALAFVCVSASILRTYSRGAILCYPIASFFAALPSLFLKIHFRKFVRLVPLLMIGTLGVLLLIPRVIERFENAPTSSGDTRKMFALTAAHVIQKNPLKGIGVNNWTLYFNTHPEDQKGEEFRESGYSETSFGIVETIYLLVAGECGIPGLVILVSWFLYYWFLALRLVFKLAGTRFFYLPTGLLGGLTGCYLQSALEWVLKQQINFMLLMVCFAILSWLNKNWRRLREESRAVRIL